MKNVDRILFFMCAFIAVTVEGTRWMKHIIHSL